MAKSSSRARPAFRRTYIREWREYRKMRLADLAEAMDITDGYLSSLESGHKRYNQDMLEAAAEALSVSVADLLTRRPEEPADANSIFEMWEQLDADDRARLEKMIGALRRS